MGLGGRISANPPVSFFRGAAGGAQEEGHVLDTPPAWDITRRAGDARRRFFANGARRCYTNHAYSEAFSIFYDKERPQYSAFFVSLIY